MRYDLPLHLLTRAPRTSMNNKKGSDLWANPLTPWLVLLLLSLVWGSSFILIKKSLLAFPPNEVGALRVGISFLAILPLLIIRLKVQQWNLLPIFLIVGLTGNFIPALLFAYAEVKIDSGIAGVLNSLTPLFTLIIAWLFFGRQFQWKEAIGIIFGFVGAACLILFATGQINLEHLSYGLLIVIATLCYGVSVNIVNAKLSGVKPLDITILSFFTVGIPAWIYLLTSTDLIVHATQHPESKTSLLSICFLALVGTVISTIIFYRLVQKTDAIFGSLVAYLIPIVALGWAVIDGEVLLVTHFIGFGMILFGIYLVKHKKAPGKQN